MKDIFNKRQRFSIRKFSVGVASVLIGIALFTPSQGVLASTENSPSSVEKREAVQPIPDNQNNPASELDTRDVPIGSTRTTEPVTSGDKENNSLTTRDFVAGEDRSSTPEVRAASNPSEVKKYELTDEYAKQIKAGVIGSEGNKLDSLLLNGPKLSPEAYTDEDYLKDKEELYIYEKDGKKYVGYNSHPMLEDTDGDGIIDSKEKPDEKLKWNVSERDMIMFMELSYRDDDYIDKVLNNKKQLTEADLYKKKGESKPRYEYMMMNRELAPYWKRKKSYHTSSGLDAVLYETKSDFLYLPNGTAQVLAFRGTSDAKDIVADGVLGVGSNPQQGNDAENIMRELAKDKSITNLYLTGHSLGGYLVQRAMVEAYQLAYSDSRVMSPKEQQAYRNFYNNVLKKGTTFNAPKVVTSWVSRREFWQKGLDSKKIAKSGKMTHYIVDNDSTIRKGVSNDSDVVINVGRTSGGHSSRSYFEADLINRRSEFMSGKRISLDGTGYQDKKITTVKSVEKFGETTVYSKSGDDIIKSTTVSMKDPDTGQITKNTLDEVFKKDGAKAKVVVTPLDPSVRYEKDATRAKEEAKVTVSGTPGTSTVTTTYTVNPNNGEAIAHVGQPVVKQPAIETVVKVAAKDEVEYIKKGADVVKKTTSYTVNSKTGSLTSTEKEEVVNKGGAKDLVEYNSVEPKPVYLKDENSPKGTDTVQFPGKSGKTKVTTTYSVNPVNGTLTPSKSKPEVVTIPIARVVKVGAKDKVEVETIPSPVKYEKDISREKGQDNITVAGKDGSKTTTTTYTVNPNNGEAIAHVGNPVIVNPTETIVKVAAKDKVVETPIEPEVEYVKDVEENFGATSQRTEGKKGKTVTTTTYDVDPKDGHITEHVGNPVVTPAGKTIVKVGAKTKVERSKDDQGREVINTTTYEVDSKTGKVTPTTVTTYGTRKEATVEKKVVPSPVVYEKDDTKEKGTEAITVKGEDGEDTITTTYKVNPTTGEITPSVGKPVRTKEPTNTIVKVPAKDKVDVETIPSPVKYEKDTSREKGQDNITVPGKAGSKTTTTTYTVNPNNGEVTPNVGEPVIVKPTDTIIKVAAKDKVVYSKDGDNIVKEVTTYIVNPTNGNITGHTTKETFKENGLKDKVEVETIPSPVKYEKRY
nr:G5 domain-containing protein [Streptococcus mitis]